MTAAKDGLRPDAIECRGMVIPFRYCHARRRTLGMTVRPDKSVIVRAPLRASLGEIRDFVSRRAAWIAKVWREFDAMPPKPPRTYESGTVFRFLGREYGLTPERGATESAGLRGDALVVAAPDEPDPRTARRLVDAWYRDQAAVIFRERAILCHRRLAAEGIPLPAIVIRPMKSRWGSYSYRTGRMTLNLHLIEAPPACLDYVIIHELCHIRERHHGPGFWRLVERYVPDHAALRRLLNALV
ncbi:M48 family metallopeptidase [Geobacter sp. FeAm09]|uniref:M48 family metallopeptidase n=1 Tax=Geobacter sp. FeAm09 TaxID=2597769 RepID=UPI0011EEBB7A|nr:SprT family zinc-dependent metalloprotease [Geobacter sp. FeAm09]QEM70013.1 M48 family metallopeptidase [Geobacter sp. FeAm09]